MSHWLPSLTLCLLMRWTAETAWHAGESTLLPSVTKKLPVSRPSNTPEVLACNTQCTQMSGRKRRPLPCPNAVNIMFGVITLVWKQFQTQAVQHLRSLVEMTYPHSLPMAYARILRYGSCHHAIIWPYGLIHNVALWPMPYLLCPWIPHVHLS